jgi:hypothetical protein
MGDDYRMQKYCQKKPYEAADKISSLAKKYPDGTEESNIIYRCGEKWRWGDTFNFTMVLYCSKLFKKTDRSISSSEVKHL